MHPTDEGFVAGAQGARRKIVRKLPGIAQRNAAGEITFIRGRIMRATLAKQVVETDSKIYPILQLLGSNYMYWCETCHCTVYEEEVLRIGRHACPFCDRPVFPMAAGIRVRLHFRFAQDAAWAEWWGERWDG